MKRKLLLTTTLITLIMTGCAQKKLNTIDTSTNIPVGDGTDVYQNGTEVYQNVDPYGSGNGQYGNAGGDYSVDGDIYANGGGLQKIYFDVDQYNITPDQLGTVSQDAKILKKSLSLGAKVKIEGHCDATGTDEYNYALGLRRAKAAKDALQSNGVNSNKILLVSMGESSPECTTSTSAECYAKNRRVEFKVIQ